MADMAPETTPNAYKQTTPEPSKLASEDLMRVLKGWWEMDNAHFQKWYDGDEFNIGMKEAFDFVSNRQWTDKELKYLEDQKRPAVTFNRILPTVSAICGTEINSRHDIAYLPTTSDIMDERGQMIVKANETLSEASKSMADDCDAEDHESESFRDAAVSGMGWLECRVDYDEDPKGKYTETSIFPSEMRWDYRAREKNLADAKRLWRLKPMQLSEAKALFPDVPEEDLNASWATPAGEDRQPRSDQTTRRNEDEEIDLDYDPKSEIHVAHVQWLEYERIWMVADEREPDKVHEVPVDKMQALESFMTQNGFRLTKAPGRRRVYKQCILGRVPLTKVSEPQFKNGFTWSCITGIPDKNRRYWYGLVAVMRDPQRWANAWLSQTMHILNSTAKGGIIAERDAFEDTRQAENSYARPDAISWAASGAIAKNKIMAKPGVGISAGHANLLEFAISSIRDVTGINLELLGLRDANQPGILEAQRKQAAMTILAPWFDSLRRARKLIGRVRLYYIQRYLADGRMVRISGEDGYRLIQLTKQDVIGEHDVVVSDAPTSPNQKQETWALIQPMLPLFQPYIESNPQIALMILKYSPLPSKLVDALASMLNTPPSPEEQQQKAIAQAGAVAQVKKDEASAEQSHTAAVLNLAKAAAEQHQMRVDAVIDQVKQVLPKEKAPRQGKMIEGEAFAVPPIEGIPPPQPAPMMAPEPVQQAPVLPEMAPADMGRVI